MEELREILAERRSARYGETQAAAERLAKTGQDEVIREAMPKTETPRDWLTGAQPRDISDPTRIA
jgi:hypothetical protein